MTISLYLWIANLVTPFTTRVLPGKRAQPGQGLVEYALVIAVVAVIAVAGLTLLGNNLHSTFSNLIENLNLPNPGS